MKGKVITVNGLIDPSELGKVMMHEHLHFDCYDWGTEELVEEEKQDPQRLDYMLEDAVPFLKQCVEHGGRTFVDVTMSPWRGWPDIYQKVSEASGFHIIMSTGFYREVEVGTYWVKTEHDAIWPFARQASVEELTEFCIKEISEGINGTEVRAGAVKLGTSAAELTPTETKCFQAGARAQIATGVHITTHCTKLGAETSQLRIFADEGVDLSRVVIGHTAPHLTDPDCRKVCIDWMKEGANFLPTNMGIGEDGGAGWQPLINAIHEIFDMGLGDKIAGFGLDSGYTSESAPFGRIQFIPPDPFFHMYSHTLPAFRKMGLTPEEEQIIMIDNPSRILPVQ